MCDAIGHDEKGNAIFLSTDKNYNSEAAKTGIYVQIAEETSVG